MAWLNAVPERPENDKSKAPRLSRLESLRKLRKDDKYMPDMPSVEAEHTLDYLFEIGPVMGGSMGVSPITNEEIQAWQLNTGIELQSWQARLIRRLSLDYLTESQKAEKRDCPAPWIVEKLESKLVAANMRQQIKELAKL
jgi:hypothetical protein